MIISLGNYHSTNLLFYYKSISLRLDNLLKHLNYLKYVAPEIHLKIEIFFLLFICVLFIMLELHPRLFMC